MFSFFPTNLRYQQHKAIYTITICSKTAFFVSYTCTPILQGFTLQLPRNGTHSIFLGYIAEIHWLVEALTKKQERLHIAIATGVLCVKLERESITQSRTMEDCPVLCSVWNTCKILYTGIKTGWMDMERTSVSLVKVLSGYKALRVTNWIPGDNSESNESVNWTCDKCTKQK